MGQPRAHASALSFLNELRAAFQLPPLGDAELSDAAAHELIEAEPLLVMLAARTREPGVGATLKDELRHAWNKALRRRGWSALPGLESRVASQPPARASDAEQPAQLIGAFLASFGVAFDGRMNGARVSSESLAHAHALCVVLMQEVDALRTTPLLAPEAYAVRFHAVVARWNELARRRIDLPALSF